MGILASDTFTRADNGTALGTAETGGAYIEPADTSFGIVSNKAYNPGAPSPQVTAGLSVGTANVRLTCTITTCTTNTNRGLAARITNASNCLRLHLIVVPSLSLNGLYLSKFIGGAQTDLGGSPAMAGTLASSTTYIVEWTMNGPNHTIKVDGVTVLTASDSNAQDAVTVHGLCFGGADFDTREGRWDNLLIEDLAYLVSYRFAGPWEAPWSQ